MTLRIHNSLTRQSEPFRPLEPGRVRMYVCGLTVYDLSHVGHARMLVAFDVIQRWFKASGFEVTYVRNITDIDDKIIRRALERDLPIRQLTDTMVAEMHADLETIGVERPTHEPRATEFVPQMLAMIDQLEDRGLAYRGANGDVNYAVREFPRYGQLSGKSIDELRSGERVAVLDGKRDPLDFVLWKSAKPEEPDDAKYPSRHGPGRPGWHIECSAMAAALLGEQFDLHGGGADLQFPHHENEIAQSQGATGVAPARIWAHNGLLNVDHVKMSKSLGNFFTIREVLERYDGETIRFFLLRTHYRSPFNFSDAGLDDARASLVRLYTALEGAGEVGSGAIDWEHPVAVAFHAAMDDDFNTPNAVAALFELAGELNRSGSSETAALLRGLGGTLGILQQPARAYLQTGAALGEADIAARIAERDRAKQQRDFATADRIRAELSALGIQLKDAVGGTTWVKG